MIFYIIYTKRVDNMEVKILGSTASIPDVGNDCPCFLVNEKFLIDCGLNVLSDLRETNCDLSKIRYIIFTHMHHDHYLGLAGLLFYFIHSRVLDISELTIIGPKDNLCEVLEKTYGYLQLKKHYPEVKLPKVTELSGNEKFTLSDCDFETKTGNHSIFAIKYRITEKSTNSSLAVAGDTSFDPSDSEFFKACDLLIHDATLSVCDKEILNHRPSGHSTIFEAVKAAEGAGIKTLIPMHMTVKRAEEAVEAVKDLTDVKVIAPVRGETYKF